MRVRAVAGEIWVTYKDIFGNLSKFVDERAWNCFTGDVIALSAATKFATSDSMRAPDTHFSRDSPIPLQLFGNVGKAPSEYKPPP